MTDEVCKESVSKELCDERSNNLKDYIRAVEAKTDSNEKQLRWFFITAIATLLSVVANIALTAFKG